MKTKKSRLGLTIGLVISVLALLLSFPVSWLADYFTHLNQFSHGVKSQDRDEAQKGLEVLKEDYNHFVKWKFQYPADRFLFAKIHLYEAEVSILNEDFEKVEKEDLKNRESWEASYLLGISKFWTLHAAYQEAMRKKNKEKMNQILETVLTEVKADFEKCVKDGPGPAENFSCSFNYDLTSDPDSATKALANPKPQITYVLGKDGDKPGRGPDKKKPPKKGDNDDKKSPGQGGAKKVG